MQFQWINYPVSFFISKFTCSKNLILTSTKFRFWKTHNLTTWFVKFSKGEKKEAVRGAIKWNSVATAYNPPTGESTKQKLTKAKEWQRNWVGFREITFTNDTLSSELTYSRCTHLRWATRTSCLHFCGEAYQIDDQIPKVKKSILMALAFRRWR